MTWRFQRPQALAVLILLAACLPHLLHGQTPRERRPVMTGWKVKFDEGGSTPVIVDGVMYLGSADGAVYALDANTGATKWRFQTGDSLSPASAGPEIIVTPDTTIAGQMATAMKALSHRRSGSRRVDMTPAVAGGTVFVGSGDNLFYALDSRTGQKKWSYEAGRGLASSSQNNATVPAPILTDDAVLVGTDDGLYALDALGGTKKWLVETSQGRVSSRPTGPILAHGTVFLSTWPPSDEYATHLSRLFAVDPGSGAVRWMTTVYGFDITTPVASAGLVFVAVRGTLYAINPADGQIKWQYDANGASDTRGLILGDSTIHFGTNQELVALDQATGHVRWRFAVDRRGQHPDEITTDVQSDDHHLYVVTGSLWRSKYQLHALALGTGEAQWSWSGGYIPRLVVEDGIVYADGADKEHLRAIEAATGKALWSFKGSGRETTRLIAAGRLYLTTPTVRYFGMSRVTQGYLYAIDAKTGKLIVR